MNDRLRENLSSKNENRDSVSLRSFLFTLMKTLYVILGFLLLWPILRFLTYSPDRKKKIVITGFDSLILPLHKEGVIVNLVNKKIVVFSDRCTHLGCIVRFDPVSKEFRCPCHGSKFDKTGRKIAGPAKLPLVRLPFEKDKNGNLIIWFPLSLEK